MRNVSSFRSWRRAAAAAVSLVTLGLARGADMPAGHPPVPTPALSTADLQFFEAKVRPILVGKCYNCHSKEADKVRGGFLLDTREALLHGGNSGPAIVPGNPDDSLLVQAIRYKDEDLQMPPKGEKLSDREIADLTEWVRRGAPDPRTLVVKGSSHSYGGVGKQHWAFQPVKKPAIPAVQNSAWVKSPVDNFVLAKLEASGMAPNEPAEKATLIRRVYFDLIGLPPSLRDVQAFVQDTSPDALAKVVDRLLGSSYYGEHWGRYWLDVARYSDTKGDAPRQDDVRYPHAWTYRDWVIAAFNADMPYNEFVLQQLAGDRVQATVEKRAKDKGVPLPQTRSAQAALGFLTLGNTFDGRRDDVIGDQIDVTTKAFLGLTVACARCHDHKFDPIPTKDYYSLYGVFRNTQIPGELPTLQTKVPDSPELVAYIAKSAELAKERDELKAEREKYQASVAQLRRAQRLENPGSGKAMSKAPDPKAAKAAIAAMPMNVRAQQQDLQRRERLLQRAMGDLESTHAGAPARANALEDVRRSIDYPVLLRGEVANRGEIVPRRFLEILSPDPKKRPEWRSGSGRLELALSIIDPKNPLTARVLVNRVWQQHWGEGFVATPDDLGNMSSQPTHPELLDYLAATFVEQGWSIKQLHRMIVLSAAYRQSAKNNPKYAEQDPNNKLLWRYNLRRLDFEQMHDALLAITGELDPTVGGRPVPISSEGFARRRAIYTLIDRTNPAELLTQFDFPSPDVVSGRRYQTIVPQQALFLMNSPMVIEAARHLVERPVFSEIATDAERVAALYLAIYQRGPTKEEVALGLRYVKANPTGSDLPEAFAEAAAKAKNPRDARKADRQQTMTAKQQRVQGKFSTQVGGVFEKRAPLDAWTKLAHALFQSNEAMFYD